MAKHDTLGEREKMACIRIPVGLKTRLESLAVTLGTTIQHAATLIITEKLDYLDWCETLGEDGTTNDG